MTKFILQAIIAIQQDGEIVEIGVIVLFKKKNKPLSISAFEVYS